MLEEPCSASYFKESEFEWECVIVYGCDYNGNNKLPCELFLNKKFDLFITVVGGAPESNFLCLLRSNARDYSNYDYSSWL